jgi:hypothetical protein
MNRARSPLFIIALLVLAIVGAGAGLFIEASGGTAPWKTASSLHSVQSLALTLFCVGMTIIGLIIIAEIAIKAGWEPKWLRIRYVGVVILNKEADFDNPRQGWLTVALPNKEMERFHADESEFNLVEPTNLVVLEVIGQYVADVRRMKGQTAAAAEAEAADPVNRVGVRRHASLIKPASAGFRAWLWMLGAPVVGGGLIGDGILTLVMGSADYSYRRNRYSRSYGETIMTGGTAVWYAVALIFIGLVILGVALYYWKSGWDPSTFETDDWEPDDRRGCRPGRHW